MRITPDLELLKLETPVSRAVSYRTWVPFVDGLLLDTGFMRARRQLFAALAGRKVEQVANTHGHEDHCGNNRAVAERFGAMLYAPQGALPSLANPETEVLRPYQHVVWGMPRPSYAQPLKDVVHTPSFTFQVVPTPGHAQHHVCFFEAERGWLFSGDLYLGSQAQVSRPAENIQDLITSLERVAALNPRHLFCYHRGPVEPPGDALRRKIDFLRDTRARVVRLHEEGASPRRIVREVLGGESWGFALSTGGDFSKLHFVNACLKVPGQGYPAPSAARCA